MLLKILNTVSIVAVSGVLLGSAFSSSSQAMEETEGWGALVSDLRYKVVRYTSKLEPYFSKTDWKTIQFLRLTSQNWKQSVDTLIVADNLLTIHLGPNNYRHDGLKGMAPLAWAISLNGRLSQEKWDETNAVTLETALLTHTFSNVWHLRCDVRNNPIGEEGILSLTSAFKGFSQLQCLEIYGNVGEKGWKMVGKSLQDLPNLESILIQAGQMSAISTKKFIEGLSGHKKLSKLSLMLDSCIEGGDVGVLAMAAQLKNLESLRYFSMDGKNFSPSVKAEFLEKAKKHRPDLKFKFFPSVQ